MGLKKNLGLCIFVILISFSLISALDTPIKVKTQANYAVTIRALDITGKGTLENGGFIDKIADENGIVEVVFSSETVNKIDVSLMIKKSIGGSLVQFSGGPVQIFDNDGEHIKTGWLVEIDANVNPPIVIKSGKPEGVESSLATTETINESENTIDVIVEVNESSESNINQTEVDSESKSITGNVIADFSKSIFKSKITYFLIIGLFGCLIAVFIIRKRLNSQQLSEEMPERLKQTGIKVTKYSDFLRLKEAINGPEQSQNPEIAAAEKKLEEARKTLEELKKRKEKEDRIKEAKERFERDRMELETLERGE